MNKSIGELFNKEYYEKIRNFFGCVFIESDLDLAPEYVYEKYVDRFTIETIFKRQKSDFGFSTIRVHTEFSILGQQFIVEIIENLHSKLFKKLKSSGVLSKKTVREVLIELDTAWRTVCQEERNTEVIDPFSFLSKNTPHSDDDSWVHTTSNNHIALEKLQLALPAENNAQPYSNCSQKKEESKTQYKKRHNVLPVLKIVKQFIDIFFRGIEQGKDVITDKFISLFINLIYLFFLASICLSKTPKKYISNKEASSNNKNIKDETKNNDSENVKKIGRKPGALNKKTIEKIDQAKILSEAINTLIPKVLNLIVSLNNFTKCKINKSISDYESIVDLKVILEYVDNLDKVLEKM